MVSGFRDMNSGRTFPACFSYCPSESEDSFRFVWDSLNEECFVPDGNLPAPPPPRVVLGDQAGGIIASVPKAFPACQVQSCDWHAVEAMKTKYRQSGYKKAEIEGEYEGNKKITLGLADFSWQYIKSMTFDELTANRKILLDHLKPEDRTYIVDTWQPKEDRVVWLYTHYYPNLGSTSSQRGEAIIL